MSNQDPADDDATNTETTEALHQLHVQARVPSPPDLDRQIRSEVLKVLDIQPPAEPASAIRPRFRVRRWLPLAASMVVAMAVLLFIAAPKPRPDGEVVEPDQSPQIGAIVVGDLLPVRGGDPILQPAIAARQQLLIEQPQWRSILTSDEQSAWQDWVMTRCTAARQHPADTAESGGADSGAASRDCMSASVKERVAYLEQGFRWTDSGNVNGDYLDGRDGLLTIRDANDEFARIQLSAQRADNGHVGLLQGKALRVGDHFALDASEHGEACRVELTLKGRAALVTLVGCRAQVSGGVSLAGRYQRVGKTPR